MSVRPNQNLGQSVYLSYLFSLNNDNRMAKNIRSHVGDNSVQDRRKEFPREFYIDHNFLMCVSCEKTNDHGPKSTIETHLKRAKHLFQKAKRLATTTKVGLGLRD